MGQPDGADDTAHARVTSYDVARLAGVSQSAVSRAFRDGASISQEMRARIQRAARELGYAPSNIARALITQRSRLIGVVATRNTARNNPDILFHLGHQIQEAGNRMLVFTLPDTDSGEGIPDDLFAYHVDGVIAATSLPDEVLEACARRRIPVVLFNRTGPAASVSCDHATGMRDLVSHLVRSGTRTPAFIAGPADAPVSVERLNGALDAFAAHGIALDPVVHSDYSHEGGRAAAAQLLAICRPDTIVCANDTMALGVIDACRHELGLRVPEDLGVTGFDNISQSAWPSYALTTVAQPFEQLTRTAVRMLGELVEGEAMPRERRLMPARLVVRESVVGEGHSGPEAIPAAAQERNPP